MSEIILRIGGKDYAVSCGNGEEEHVRALGETVDAKLRGMGENLAPQESQNLVFAGLLVADELHETRRKLADLEARHQDTLEDIGTARREAKTYLGQRDELTNTLDDRERELESLQSALQRSAKDSDDIRADVTRLREAEDSWAQLEKQLSGQLSEAQTAKAVLENEVEALRARAAASNNGAESSAQAALRVPEAELAPALERFADLLENCADKLEGRSTAS